MLSKLAMQFPGRKMSFPTILRRSLPTWLVWAVPLAAAAAPAPWQAHAPLPEPRTEVAAGVAGGEIVVVGGFTADGGNSARTDAYSIARNTWRRLPDLPVAVDHAASASANGSVYVVGGYGGDRNPLATAFVLGKDDDLAAAPVAARRPRRRGSRDRRRPALRPRRRRRQARPRQGRVRARPEDAALGTHPWPVPARASGGRGGRHARLRPRRPQRRDRHEHDALRGLRRPNPPLDAAGRDPAGARRHRCGVRERPHRLDRRRAPAGDDRRGLRLRVEHTTLAAARRTCPRRGTGSASSRMPVASTPSPAGRSRG